MPPEHIPGIPRVPEQFQNNGTGTKLPYQILEKNFYIKALVESQSHAGANYLVEYDEAKGGWVCTCPDHQNRKSNCKHIMAVKQGEL